MKGRTKGPGDYVDAVERASKDIDDPVEKLRFLRASLARKDELEPWLRRVPFAPARARLYRWFGARGIRHVPSGRRFGVAAESRPRSRGLAASRALVAGAAVIL